MSLKNKRLYWIKDSIDFNRCPLCNGVLSGCHLGIYCNSNNCSYVDGVAWLTSKQADKHKNKIIGYYSLEKNLVNLNKTKNESKN